jgi:hypothetical protein
MNNDQLTIAIFFQEHQQTGKTQQYIAIINNQGKYKPFVAGGHHFLI